MSSISRRGKEGAANRALALAMQGKRSSGAAGPHADKRTRRARTRSAQRARVLADQ
jgi:hypothetical protein